MQTDKLDILIASSLAINDEAGPALIQRVKDAELGARYELGSAHSNRSRTRFRTQTGTNPGSRSHTPDPRPHTRPAFRPARIAVIALSLVLLISGTVFAAWQLLSPRDVAKFSDDLTLSKAFESKDAVTINKSQTSGGYVFTLLGLITGKDLTDFPAITDDDSFANSGDEPATVGGDSAEGKLPDESAMIGSDSAAEGKAQPDRTYAVLAIQKEDGSAMPWKGAPDAGDDKPLFISPLIKGEKPWEVNITSMTGGYREYVLDGVLYRLIECDDLEVFADRGLYICATDGMFYNRDAYIFDEETGRISPDPDYDGTKALFSLPIDKSKADPEKAVLYLKNLRDNKLSRADATAGSSNLSQSDERSEPDAMKQIEEGALVLVPESVKELTPDADGKVTYEGTYKDSTFSGTYLLSAFRDETAITDHRGDSDPFVQIIKADENGVIHGSIYVPK
ncbi:MAG: hypothetical protein LBN36_06090 [Clostridiales Family XIII bacterium]|jgi:hypothetical protein|nr:hypothetical protein [Clostridiales Family XIII bacterium]